MLLERLVAAAALLRGRNRMIFVSDVERRNKWSSAKNPVKWGG